MFTGTGQHSDGGSSSSRHKSWRVTEREGWSRGRGRVRGIQDKCNLSLHVAVAVYSVYTSGCLGGVAAGACVGPLGTSERPG
ncbi:hypothetical protein E2C01_016851 [Portunus trituberculatus]|uniref:Uncharacterized protein n=1 Tax=Portunus trituberculatus TaxID=210409 RepID=A0A5B7DRM2_PORTR|nr:hypothetical protein [Portunus trituberculatus]